MTIFNFKNYTEPKKEQDNLPNTEEVSNNEDTSSDTNNLSNVQDVDKATVTISGSIAEIVAKSLYEIFPNDNNNVLSQEEHGNDIIISYPNEVNKDINIVTISKQEINDNPVPTLRLANKENSEIYIDTDKAFSTAEENWFLINLKNKYHTSLESLKQSLRKELCLK